MSKGLLHVQVPVPSYYVCPISLELMRDPVTLSTGQTFDRCSIEKWLDDGNTTCPVTRLPINPDEEEDLIPNHVLRRMIKSWVDQHHSLGVERLLSPRLPPLTLREIPALIDQIGDRRSSDPVEALQKLIKLAIDRPRAARRAMLESSALPLVGKLLSKSLAFSAAAAAATPRSLNAVDHCLRLADLLTSDDHHHDLTARRGSSALASPPPDCEDLALGLAAVVAKASCGRDTKQRAALVLSRIEFTDGLRRRVGELHGFMPGIVDLIREPGRPRYPKLAGAGAAEAVMVDLCKGCNKNRVRAVEAGAMDALSEVMLEKYRGGEFTQGADQQGMMKQKLEMALRAVEALCHCAEGRAGALGLNSMTESVVRHMSGVSERASYHAVHVLWLVVKSAPDSAAAHIKRLALEHGALVKAVAVAQSAASSDTRLAARNLATHFLHLLPATDIPHTVRL